MSAPSEDLTWPWADAPEPQPPAADDPIWQGCWGWDPFDEAPDLGETDQIVVAGALRQLSEAPGSIAAGLQTLARFAAPDRLGPATCGADGPLLSGAELVSAVQAAHRLVGWAQAQEQRLTAALARPGVAVPVCDVLDTVLSGTTPIVPDPDGVQPSDTDLAEPTRGYRQTRVCGAADWDLAVVQTAATLAEPELAAALRLATPTARTRIGAALDMVDGVPATLAAVESGRIDPYAGRLIADTTACLDDVDMRAEAERQILALADGRTPGDIGRIAADVVIQIDPAAAERRAEQARARRGTGIRVLQDDLARFYADLACEDALATQQFLDMLAQSLPEQARAGRGINALRADIFADLFTQLATVGHVDLRTNPPDPTHDEPNDPSSRDEATTDGQAPDDHAEPNDPPDRDDATTDDQAPDEPTESLAPTARPGATDNVAADATDAEPKGPSHRGDATSADATHDGSDDRTWPPGPTDPPDSPGSTGENAYPAADASTNTGTALSPSTGAGLGPSTDPHRLVDPDSIRRGGRLSQLRLPDTLRVNLDITIGLSTLAGIDDLPATLAGYGAITAPLARALSRAAGSVRLRLVDDRPPDVEPADIRPAATDPTDTGSADQHSPSNNGGRHRGGPDCGGPLDLGRSTYRPTAALERAVNERDRRCRFLGCALPAERCDKDHAITWDNGGASCSCNLDCLCRFHHRVKTFTTWRAQRRPDNTVTWTSPLGSHYTDKPLPERTFRPIRAETLGTRAPAEPTAASDRSDTAIERTPPDESTRPIGSWDEPPPL